MQTYEISCQLTRSNDPFSYILIYYDNRSTTRIEIRDSTQMPLKYDLYQ